MELVFSAKRKRHYARRSDAERFWSFVEKTDTCWIWHGGTNEHGYGTFKARTGPTRDDFRTVKAHRFAMLLAGVTIDGCGVLHSCDNPACVRQDHLFLGDQAANARDMAEKGRSIKGRHRRGARCIRGHLFDEKNTHHRKRGGRECRACMRLYWRRQKARTH